MTGADTSFDGASFESAYPRDIHHHFWSQARSRIVARAMRRVGGQDRQWLEIGCGPGVVVQALRAQGIRVDGCEVADVPADLMHADDLMTGTDAFDLDPLVRERYQGLLLLDVLEHLPERAAFLDRLFTMFPNAVDLLVTVPARRELWSNYDTHYGHYVRYNLEDVDREAEVHRWTLLGARYFFHSLYLPMALQANFRGRRDVTISGPAPGLKRLAHRLLAEFCVLESRIVPGRMIGTSIMISFKRR